MASSSTPDPPAAPTSTAQQQQQPQDSPSPIALTQTNSASQNAPASPTSDFVPTRPRRSGTTASVASVTSSLRNVTQRIMDTEPPRGMWAATGTSAARAPTLADIRRGSFGLEGWTEAGQKEYEREKLARRESIEALGPLKRRLSRSSSGFSGQGGASPTTPTAGRGKRMSSAGVDGEPFPAVKEEGAADKEEKIAAPEQPEPAITSTNGSAAPKSGAAVELEPGITVEPEPSGYIPPPKLPWMTSTAIGLKAFLKWFFTPLGFCITIYGLNVVAWGGMLFLLLCNAAPAMCHPTCNDINSPRRIWIEIDSQILNGLFCVTGFGLVPWRFRDLYWLLVFRLGLRGRAPEQRIVGLRRLAGIHNGWFRLPGSDQPEADRGDLAENPAVPLPVEKKLDLPLTGVRAPPTPLWKMDFVIWMNCWNTFFQICLCGFMWGMNRYTRPSWSTGLFVALACIVAGVAGAMMFHEGKYVKKVEGVPPAMSEERIRDIELALEKAKKEDEKRANEKRASEKRANEKKESEKKESETKESEKQEVEKEDVIGVKSG